LSNVICEVLYASVPGATSVITIENHVNEMLKIGAFIKITPTDKVIMKIFKMTIGCINPTIAKEILFNAAASWLNDSFCGEMLALTRNLPAHNAVSTCYNSVKHELLTTNFEKLISVYMNHPNLFSVISENVEVEELKNSMSDPEAFINSFKCEIY